MIIPEIQDTGTQVIIIKDSAGYLFLNPHRKPISITSRIKIWKATIEILIEDISKILLFITSEVIIIFITPIKISHQKIRRNLVSRRRTSISDSFLSSIISQPGR